jgi:hypothetical protein
VTAFDRYVAAWNAGDLESWIAVHAGDVEYVSLATGEARTFRGEEGLREIWRESRVNWDQFALSVLDDQDGTLEVSFRGIEAAHGIQLAGVLWFRVEEREGRIARIWSALDAGLLPGS